MSLVYRIKRLVKSDAYALVEGLENPKAVLAQAIRDMEHELEKQENQVQQARAQREMLQRKAESWQENLQASDTDIDLAITEKREDIAKSLVRKSLVIKSNLNGLAEEVCGLERDLAQNEKDLAEKRQIFSEICARSEAWALVSDHPDDPFRQAEDICARQASLEHEVELEFLKRMKRKS